MITKTEINEVSLSPTKKDYYQIWNELMEITSSLSERWNPEYTNESDPGVVLLKVLTAVGDKLSYNTDKATLEHFLPSATQVESVRSLCSTLGYDMKYYNGATCDVTFAVNAGTDVSTDTEIYFPKFTNVKNTDNTINYVTLKDFILTADTNQTVSCMEGTLYECASDNDNIITLAQLDTRNRYILPEANIAENGIFVSNIVVVGDVSSESSPWDPVSNLNTVVLGTKAYKFGYDSKEQLPYIQFTDEISTLIGDGLRIRYVRTNGYNGNVKSGTLTTFETPAIWSTAEDEVIKNLGASDFTVANYSASTNGTDPESIDAAYANFKKTVGTFDTLVTCRDYMSAIYKMTTSEYDTTPLVSNIVVTDVRDDLNAAQTLCSFNEYGICYSNKSNNHYQFIGELSETEFVTETLSKAQILYTYDADSKQYVRQDLYMAGSKYYKLAEAINKFDLVLYPFKTVKGLNNNTEYVQSFKYNAENTTNIITNLETNKTLAHNIITTDTKSDNIVAIKNYIRLKCKVTTVKKVTAAQEKSILNNIYTAIYTNFNARQLDFGEQIPTETIESVIKNADSLIKDISLDDSTLVTKFLTADNEEYLLLASSDSDDKVGTNARSASILYNRLALRNVLAGKIAAFDYDTNFVASFTENSYPGYARSYPQADADTIITKITSTFTLGKENQDTDELDPIGGNYTLQANEVIQFTSPNFKTICTYPAYVNYFVHYANSSGTGGTPAKMISIKEYLNDLSTSYHTRWDYFMSYLKDKNALTALEKDDWSGLSDSEVLSNLTAWLTQNAPVLVVKAESSTDPAQGTHVLLQDDASNAIDWYGIDFWKKEIKTSDSICFKVEVKAQLSKINDYFKTVQADETSKDLEESLYVKTATDRGLYLRKSQNIGTTGGRLIDDSGYKYVKCTSSVSDSDQFSPYYIPLAYVDQKGDTYEFVKDGIGKDAEYVGQANDTYYKLAKGDYLLINYTNSTSDSDGNSISNVVNKVYKYEEDNPVYIKANFDLIDSTEYHSTHSYSKESGFEFESTYQPAGMFTLGTNEQIEICEPIQVELDDNVAYLCWTREDDAVNTNSITGDVEFKFDEIMMDAPASNPEEYIWTDINGDYVPNAYTLKDNEYLYYTDSTKQNLVYYGKGTTIRRHQHTPTLYKKSNDVDPSAEDVASYGLIASLPWHAYALSDRNNTKRSLTIIENQIISLTEGDQLIGVQAYDASGNEPSDAEHSPTSIQTVLQTGVQTNIYSARYQFAEADTAEDLPIAPAGTKWKGTAKLNIAMTQTTPQTLHEYDTITIHGTNGYTQDFKPSFNTDKVIPMNIYSNYPCTTTNNVLSTTLYDADNNLKDYGLAFKVAQTNVVEIGDLTTSSKTASLNMNNYSDYWTKVNFNEYLDFANTETKSVSINLSIGIGNITTEPTRFGLLMIYYIDDYYQVTGHKCCKLTAYDSNNQSVASLARMSTYSKGSTNSDELELQPGINVIRIENTCEKLTITSDTGENAMSSIIVFSPLDIVTGVNSKLDYRITNSSYTSTLDQLLADIQDTGLANEFYYNTIISNSSAIDLNNDIEDELLSNPAAWYDTNNVNKKFVISEIDSSYFSTGITLTKQSRSY